MEIKKDQSIIQTINLVMQETSKCGIGKNQKIEFGKTKYNVRGIDDIHDTLAPILAKYGLVIIPEVISKEVKTGEIKSREFTQIQEQIHITMKYNFYHIHNEQTVAAVLPGEAFDTSDKANAKALSIAYKYMAIQSFCIPVVGDDDQDLHNPEVTITDTMVAKKNRIEELYHLTVDQEIKTWMDKNPTWKDNTNKEYLSRLEDRLLKSIPKAS